jgi:glycine/D-amino acid oxidase-like deaminating enzyme
MKRTAEVVIVGGGCMGASVAYHLARLGVADVVLVEREQMLGTGSTGRNAGGVRHQFSNDANIGCRSNRSHCSNASRTKSASRSISTRTAICFC